MHLLTINLARRVLCAPALTCLCPACRCSAKRSGLLDSASGDDAHPPAAPLRAYRFTAAYRYTAAGVFIDLSVAGAVTQHLADVLGNPTKLEDIYNVEFTSLLHLQRWVQSCLQLVQTSSYQFQFFQLPLVAVCPRLVDCRACLPFVAASCPWAESV